MPGNRSPNYPAVSLREAIDLVTKLHDKERRTSVDAVLAVRAWGYNVMSGRARGKLSALRKYGLLDGRGENYRVSDRAMAILFPENPEEKANAIRDAALAPELFAEMASHEGASDDNLMSRLIRNGFTADGARIAIASFRETMSLVSGEEPRYDTENAETPAVLTQSAVTSSRDRLERATPDISFPSTLRYGLYDNVIVEIKVSGGALTSKQIDLLREYLALQEKAVLAAESASAVPVSSSEEPSEPQQPS
jgi:hypothetical protein